MQPVFIQALLSIWDYNAIKTLVKCYFSITSQIQVPYLLSTQVPGLFPHLPISEHFPASAATAALE